MLSTPVGVPISNDQKPNLMRAQANGFAKMLNLQTMTKDNLFQAIQNSMNDEEMINSMEKMHELFTDHSFGGTPVNKAVAAIDLGMVSHKMSIVKKFGHKQKSVHKF